MASEKSASKRSAPRSAPRSARVIRSQQLVWCCRGVYLTALLGVYLWYDDIQHQFDNIWLYLRSTWIFGCVYFETWWATAWYPIILAWPFLFSKIKYFDKYKINPGMTWRDAGVKSIVCDALKYATPLMVLDTFMVKRYCGVSYEAWSVERRSWIQYNRLLPVNAPTVFQITWHLAASFVFYDILFYAVHIIVHKNVWLYKHMHAVHHDHDVMDSRVTNQLQIVEQIVLVLSANQSLRIVDAHPITRAIFVPLFLAWLVENHCGYDLPWALDKLIPFQLVGGSRNHYDHHMKGTRNYQPFFTYIDRFVNRKTTYK